MTKILPFEPFAPFQLILASTYSGAFHPTAEGQAAIADAVADKARAVLAKYGEGPDAEPTGYSVPSPADIPPVAEPNVEIPDVKSVLSKAQGGKAPITGAIPATDPAPYDDSDVGAPDPEDKPEPLQTIGVTSGAPGSDPPPASAAAAPAAAAAAAATAAPTQAAAEPPATPAPAPGPNMITLQRSTLPPIGDAPTKTGPAVSESPVAGETTASPPAVAPASAPPADDAFAPKPFAPASSGN
jgi:hypothetical protein